MSLNLRVILVVLAAALMGAALTAAIAYGQAAASLQEAAARRLAVIAAERAEAVQRLAVAVQNDLKVQAVNPAILTALEELRATLAGLPEATVDRIHTAYVDGSPHPVGDRWKLERGDTGTGYDAVHSRWHTWLRQQQQVNDYYDLFLIDTAGQIVYSVFKEADFMTGLAAGPWRDSGLARAWQAAMALGPEDPAAFVDFEPYAPSNGAPAAFVARPVFARDGALAGVLAFQMPIDRINSIVRADRGLGETGDAMLVGPDQLLRSQRRFGGADDVLSIRVEHAGITTALNAGEGTAEGLLPRGMRGLTAFMPVVLGADLTWAILVEQALEEIDRPVEALRNQVVLVTLAVMVVVGAVGLWLARAIVRPITTMTGAMQRLAEGDHAIVVEGEKRRDEIGAMARSLLIFRDNAAERRRLREDQQATERRTLEEQQASRAATAEAFEKAVGSLVAKVAEDIGELGAAARRVEQAARETSGEAGMVASAAEQSSAGISTVAAATQQFSASIREINARTSDAQAVALRASDEARGSHVLVDALTRASERIGAVISLISDIAARTNLLALNATIEAARAGEAGKGFAVVASEVKGLANQTAKATAEISSEIQQMRQAIEGTVGTIATIASTIDTLTEANTAISGAIEEQSATTADISRTVEEASGGVGEIARAIARVSRLTSETGGASDQMLAALKTLEARMAELRLQTEAFVTRIRAG